MSSVGRAFAIARGRLTGDHEKAKKLLDSLSPGELTARNRSEARTRVKTKRNRYKMGRTLGYGYAIRR